MKITHVLWGLQTGGTEYMLADIANEQVKTDEVFVIVVDDNVDKNVLSKFSSKISFFFCNRKRGHKSIIAVAKLNFYLFKISPDITHLHMGYGLGKMVLWPGKKVRTVHNTTNSPAEYHKFDRIVAISKAVQKEICSYGFESILVSNGVKIDAIKHRDLKKEKNGCVHIVQIGRLFSKQKGQDLLIKAVDCLVKASDLRYLPPFKIHFVGSGDDLDYLQKMISEKQLEKYFIFEGAKDRDWIYSHLCDFDLFVQPSYYEGFGLSVVEAAAAKIPVLVSNIEGPKEILYKDGEFVGWLFNVGDVADLSKKIADFLNGKYDDNLCEKAYEHMAKYNVLRTASEYLSLYRELLSK